MAGLSPPVPAGDGQPVIAEQHDADQHDPDQPSVNLPAADPLRGELEALWRLGPDAVRRRWRAQVGRPTPKGLGRGLTLRILAYHDQVQRHGGLDKASQRVLAASAQAKSQASSSEGEQEAVGVVASASASAASRDDHAAHRVAPCARTPDLLRPGTLLQREHGGVLHRVTVLADGVSWNGRTFDSLSQVALAITGTRWNGPRFFGLRGRPERGNGGKKPSARPAPGRSKARAEAARSVGR